MEQHGSEKSRHTGTLAVISIACFVVASVLQNLSSEVESGSAMIILDVLAVVLTLSGIILAGKVAFNVFNTLDTIHKNNTKRE